MSVYTQIDQQQLTHFLSFYSLGTAIDYKGVEAGVENTNYFVTTTKGEYILTIFEVITVEALPFYFNLLQHYSENDLSVPTPQKSQGGNFFHLLAGKPAALFNRILGHSITHPSPTQCAEIGRYLATLHLLSPVNQTKKKESSSTLINSCATFKTIKSKLTLQDSALIESELDFQMSNSSIALPSGIIHADLFKDNVLFKQGRISGILDFYDACDDCFVLDIAITCNDWCVEKASINQDKFESLLAGYNKVRTLTDDEMIYLPVYLRLAALRFWVSRLFRQLNPRQSELTLEKDPVVFHHILQAYR